MSFSCFVLSLIYSLSFILICLEAFSLIAEKAAKQASLGQRPLSRGDSGMVPADAVTGGTPGPQGRASDPVFLAAGSGASVKVVLQGVGSPPDAGQGAQRVVAGSSAHGVILIHATPVAAALPFPGCH